MPENKDQVKTHFLIALMVVFELFTNRFHKSIFLDCQRFLNKTKYKIHFILQHGPEESISDLLIR